jgi:hypothetical protein
VVISFPLSYTGSGTSVFNILLECDDCTGETTWDILEFGLIGGGGGGKGIDAMSQPWLWTRGWWTVSCQPSLAGILVSLIYEEGLRCQTSFDVLERVVFHAGDGGSLALLG